MHELPDYVKALSESFCQKMLSYVAVPRGLRDDIKAFWASALRTGYCGNGRNNFSVSACSNWMFDPPKEWTGTTYIKAIQLRGNLLPTVKIPSNPPHARKCRVGCSKAESLSHVLQSCYTTHEKRTNRHNIICVKVADECRKSGLQVLEEPKLRLGNGELKKPDLVVVNSNGSSAVVCDVEVHWKGATELAASWHNKRAVYNTEAMVEKVKLTYNVREVRCLPIIVEHGLAEPI